MIFAELFGAFDLWSINIPTPMALAAVALFGYIYGRKNRKNIRADADQARRELRRAKAVARQLEQIAESVRKNLATHRASVSKFKDRVSQLSNSESDASWNELCREAEDMLKPTLKLAMQLSMAYDEIRQQSTLLMSFSEVRTDPLTGVSNRRALDEMLDNMFALMVRYKNPFSLAIFDIDHFKQINDDQGHLYGDRTLQKFARLLDNGARETDMVARYGGEEFVVVMPQTSLEGACVFSDRTREEIESLMPITISGGLAVAREGDTPQSLLARADAALYSAKAAGRNRVFRHDGQQMTYVVPETAPNSTPSPVVEDADENPALEAVECSVTE